MTTAAGLARSRLVAVVSFVLAVALAAAALRVSDAGPDYQQITGETGQQLALEDGWVRVGDVRVGDVLGDEYGEPKGRTAGMFVLLRLTVAATGRRQVRFNDAQLVTADRTYDTWSLFSASAEPDFSSTSDVLFEVDPAQIDDLSLLLAPGGVVTGYDQRPLVHLGITTENAQQWRDAARGQVLKPAISSVEVGLA